MTPIPSAELYRKSEAVSLHEQQVHHHLKKNDGLQILRAIAALLVVHRHSIEVVRWNQFAQDHGSYNIDKFGAFGVDVFFVISGYILSTVVLRTRPDTPRPAFDFLTRRYIRILPIYWITSLAMLAIYMKQKLIPITPGWVARSLLLLPSLESRLRVPLIVFGWTLVFEMFFYYVLSFNMLFGKRKVVLRSIASIALLVAIGAAVGFERPILVLVANPINVEFLLGCCIALLYTKIGPRPTLGVVLMLTGGLLLGATVVFGFGHLDDATLTLNSDRSWYRLLLWGLPSAILTAGFVFRPTQLQSAFGRLWVFLGDASYSIYLTSAVTLFLAFRFFNLLLGLPPNLNIALIILFVAIGGAATYLWVERPITQFLTEKYLQARARTAA